MYHFFTDNCPDEEGIITITGPDVNHIGNVLRLHSGEKITLSAKEAAYVCEIVAIDKSSVAARVLEKAPDNELPVRITLYQGLPKSDKMELIIQKAVELGAYSVVPVENERTIVHLDDKKKKTRTERWQAISESAAKQSGRNIIPEVTEPVSYKKALDMAEGSLMLIAYEGEKTMQALGECMSKLSSYSDISIFIGPEGGYSEEEVLLAEKEGAIRVSLGCRILRTETAGLALLSAIMIQLEVQKHE